jgi:hypothetical protein
MTNDPNSPVFQSTDPILTWLLQVEASLLQENQAALDEIQGALNRLIHEPISEVEKKRQITNQGNFVSDMSVQNEILSTQVEQLKQISLKLRKII